MANVTNHHSGPLGLPGGPTIPPGATVPVNGEIWNVLKSHATVKVWIDNNLLVAEDEKAPDDDVDTGVFLPRKSEGTPEPSSAVAAEPDPGSEPDPGPKKQSNPKAGNDSKAK